MDMNTLLAAGITFFQNHTIPAVAILAVVAVMAFVKPKEIFKLLLVALTIGIIFYLISFMSDSMSTGIEHKDTLTHKSGKNIE
ncbi:MAG: hypothetical protein H8E41_03575 [Desulfobulbaceae bacterium]|uniref:Uncharacterized protein n=1 Tax=Candidatus Desulfobia pelagia TaxID=2841692 RepID=A0A8J6NCQ4_9BACT|nr:hypothetical protein [Candidatus Desulfobia pelagia]